MRKKHPRYKPGMLFAYACHGEGQKEEMNKNKRYYIQKNTKNKILLCGNSLISLLMDEKMIKIQYSPI